MKNKNTRELDEMTYSEIFEHYSNGIERINDQFMEKFTRILKKYMYSVCLLSMFVGLSIGIVIGIFI